MGCTWVIGISSSGHSSSVSNEQLPDHSSVLSPFLDTEDPSSSSWPDSESDSEEGEDGDEGEEGADLDSDEKDES